MKKKPVGELWSECTLILNPQVVAKILKDIGLQDKNFGSLAVKKSGEEYLEVWGLPSDNPYGVVEFAYKLYPREK